MNELLNKIDEYLDTHCLIFFHDWECTDEAVPNMQSSEQWYWHLDRCRKCKAERAMMNNFRKEVDENEKN